MTHSPAPRAPRPLYHYAAAANWLSDPNGLVHLDGEWHMFYQYNPNGDQWGHMAWGHAISRDLVHWHERPPALIEDERHLIFSGSAVVDRHGSAGFGAGALVAIYTGAGRSGRDQVQCLAASTDRGRSWIKFADNPVIDRQSADFRDPNVFWHAPTDRWIMVVALSNQDRAVIYASDDLKDWHEVSSIGPFAVPGRVWECPLLIELPVEGSATTRWLFKVDLLIDGPGSGAIALTGTFDGVEFVPDCGGDGAIAVTVVDGGRDFYAAIAWHASRDDAGRPCWIGWMGNHGYQAALPPRGWRGAMSLPRRLALRRVDEGYALVQTVEPAVRGAFVHGERLSGTALRADLPAASYIGITRAEPDSPMTVKLSDCAGAVIEIGFGAESTTFNRAAAIHPIYDAVVTDTALSGDVELWIDHASLEIASADGTRWISMQHCLNGATLTLSVDGTMPVEIAVSTLKLHDISLGRSC